MKKIFTFMLMLAFALFAGVSCTNDPGTQSGKTAKVTVSGAPEANLPATAGEFTLNYAIENATLTGVLEVTTEAAWVHVGEVGADSVPFTYDANTDSPDSEPREAVISFAYTDADVVTVTVKQESAAPSFEVVWDETTLSCNYAAYSVKSEVNPDMLYLATTSADLTQYGVQGETVAEKMANYVALLTQNYMIGTDTADVWLGDGYWYFKGNMETLKELYRATADDIYVYVVGFNITATEGDQWGTYATGIEFTTAVHAYKAPFLPYPTITVSGDLAKTVSSEAGSVVLDVTVENPIEGNNVLVSVDENVTWAVPTYADGKVTIAYEANTTALPREAKVYVDYGKMNDWGYPETVAEQVVYTLTQEKDGAAEVVTFDIQVVETHFNGIIVNVTPSNLEVDYYLNTTSASSFNYDTETWNPIEIDWLEKVNSDIKWGADETKCFKGALTNHRIVMTPGNYEWYGYDYHVYAFALNADKSGPASEASHVQTTVDASDMPKLTLSGGGLEWNEEDGRYELTVSKAGNYTFTYAVENPYEGASVKLNGSKLTDNYYADLIGNEDQAIFDTENNTVTFVLNGYPENWSKTFAPTCNNTLLYADDSGEYWGVQARIKITWVEDVKVLPYEESFENGQGDWTIDNVSLADGLSYVWKHESGDYGAYMKASAYVSGAKAAESLLVSPKIDLSTATMPGMQFSHAHKFAGTPAEELTLWVKEASATEWTQVTIPTYGTNDNWTFVTASVDLSAWAGKKVQVAFKYVSTASAAATWEVKDVVVYDAGGAVAPLM